MGSKIPPHRPNPVYPLYRPQNITIGNYRYDSLGNPQYIQPPQHSTYVAPRTDVPLPSLEETCEIWKS